MEQEGILGYLQILTNFIDLVFLLNKSNFGIFANIEKFYRFSFLA